MSSYSGSQGKGASKLRKKQKRDEAVIRQAEEKRREEERATNRPIDHFQEFEETGIAVISFAEVEDMSAIHNLLYQIFGE